MRKNPHVTPYLFFTLFALLILLELGTLNLHAINSLYFLDPFLQKSSKNVPVYGHVSPLAVAPRFRLVIVLNVSLCVKEVVPITLPDETSFKIKFVVFDFKRRYHVFMNVWSDVLALRWGS